MSIARNIRRYGAALAGTAVLSLAPQMAGASVQPPPNGTPPSQFASQDTGCLGPLRSMIASGQLPAGFSGGFNPGDHYGTVQEAQFLEEHGVTDLAAFCAQFAPKP